MARRDRSRPIALGGVLAALAVVIMCLGGLIPVATFVIPILCCLLLTVVLKGCGSRITWAWYGAVAILGLLLSPDKEAAALFAVLGYYPIVKPKMDKLKLPWLWKGLLFNGCIVLMYGLALRLLGMDELVTEYQQIGTVMVAVMLIVGNLVFFLLDSVLQTRQGKKHG